MHVQLTSWKREDISHTRQELGLCISQRCRSERKKSRSSGVCVSACTMQFMKHVLPRLISPRSPGGQTGGGDRALACRTDPRVPQAPSHSRVRFPLLIHSGRNLIFLCHFYVNYTEECSSPSLPNPWPPL